MVELGKVLRRDLDRAVARIIALEQVVFGRNGVNDHVEAVRAHLRHLNGSIGKMTAAQIAFIRDQLPRDWLELTYQHGHEAVFVLLARGDEISDARAKLERPHG